MFETLKEELLSVVTEKVASNIELNTLLFGRKLNKIKTQLSVFERILTTRGSSSLINLIWNKLGLAAHREILDLVSCS